MSKKRNWLVRIDHMLQVIQELEDTTGGIEDLGIFMSCPHMYRTTERILEILGEAAKYIPATVREEFPYKWEAVVGLRNIIIHEYTSVNYALLWKTVKEDVPEIKEILLRIKQKYGEAGT